MFFIFTSEKQPVFITVFMDGLQGLFPACLKSVFFEVCKMSLACFCLISAIAASLEQGNEYLDKLTLHMSTVLSRKDITR